MRLRVVVLLILGLLAAAGCRRDPRMQTYIEMLNAERRTLEDRIYELEEAYDEAVEDLEKCREENEQLRGSGRTTRPAESRPTRPRQTGPELDLPDIDYGNPSSSSQPKNSSSTTAASEPPPELPLDASTITTLYLDPRSTSGVDLDKQPGDDGIQVLLQTRDPQQRFVKEPGKITLVLLDPARRTEGEAARVGRWELSTEEVTEALANSSSRGLMLQLPWDEKPPETSRLELFVRYETESGRRLEARRGIVVQLPSQGLSTWMPRSSEATRLADRPASTVQHASGNAADGSTAAPHTLKVPQAAQMPPTRTSGTGSSRPNRPDWQPFR